MSLLSSTNFGEFFPNNEVLEGEENALFPHFSEMDGFGGAFSDLSGFRSDFGSDDLLLGLNSLSFSDISTQYTNSSPPTHNNNNNNNNNSHPSITSETTTTTTNKSRKKKATIWLEKYDHTAVVVGPISSQENFQELISMINQKSSEDFRSHYFREKDSCGFIYFTSEEGACRCKVVLDGMEFDGSTLKACCPSKYFTNPEDAYPNPGAPKQQQTKTTRPVTQQQQNEPTTTVVVRNLSFALNQDSFTNFLTSLSIFPQEVQFHYDQNACFRGLAFVKFSSTGQASDALRRLQDRELGGRVMQVELKRRGCLSSSSSNSINVNTTNTTNNNNNNNNSMNNNNNNNNNNHVQSSLRLHTEPLVTIPKPNWSRSISEPSTISRQKQQQQQQQQQQLQPSQQQQQQQQQFPLHLEATSFDFVAAVAAAGGDVVTRQSSASPSPPSSPRLIPSFSSLKTPSSTLSTLSRSSGMHTISTLSSSSSSFRLDDPCALGLESEIIAFAQEGPMSQTFQTPKSHLRVQSAPINWAQQQQQQKLNGSSSSLATSSSSAVSSTTSSSRRSQNSRSKTQVPPPNPPSCLQSLFPQGVPHVPKLLPGMEFI